MLLARGARIDSRYVVQALLGAGGMARVYAVRDQRLGIDVALKVLSLQSERIRDRLVQEGRFQARLQHPNTLAVTDIVDVAGAPGLVMPLVRGASLDRLLAQRRLDPVEAEHLFRGVVAGVARAHELGLIHRDLKPANVLVEVVGSTLVPKVADFGLAKLMAENAPSGTRSGVAMGTPQYMAPEQIRDAKHVDHRADLFALGALLYELLQGAPAFVGTDTLDLFLAIAEGRWTRPTEAVEPRLLAVIEACLAVDPAARVGSCGALLALLDSGPAPVVRWRAGTLDAVRALAVASAPDHDVAVDDTHTWGATAQGEPRPATEPEPPGVPVISPRSTQPTPPVPCNLPAQRDAFVGRRADLADLDRRLAEGARLVSVLGIGGTGKTRLVVQYGWAHVADWPGGVWFCDLSEARGIDGIVYAVGRALDVPLGKEDPILQLGQAFAGRGSCLVILDNFEQVARHAEATLGQWLDRAREATFVVTTREVLGLPGESSLALPPLVVDEGTALFVNRAAAADRTFTLNADNEGAVRKLVQLLDGLPLAIELAAARVRMMPPATLLQRMSERFKLLSSSGGRHTRQATLRATIDWSWDLLSPDEREALAQLSVFEGGFTLEAAEGVLDLGDAWVVDALRGLQDKSLLRRPTDRFDLLVSVQTYAAERLVHREAVEVRHGAWFARMADSAEAELRGPDGSARRRARLHEIDNLVAACRRANARGDVEQARRLLLVLNPLLAITGPLAPLVDLAQHTLALATDDESVAVLAMMVARALQNLGRIQEADQAAERGVQAALRTGQDVQIAAALGERAVVQLAVGDPVRASEDTDQALAVARRVGDLALLEKVLGDAGVLWFLMERFEAAEAATREAVALAQALDDRLSMPRHLTNLALLALRAGRTDEAEATLRDAIERALAEGDRRLAAHSMVNLGVVCYEAERFDEAAACYERALPLCRELGNSRLEGGASSNLAAIEMDQGLPDRALPRLQRAVALAVQSGDRWYEAARRQNLGNALRDGGRTEDAIVEYRRSLALCAQTRNRDAERLTRCAYGEVLAAQGHLREACAMIEPALELGGVQAWVLFALAGVLARMGDLEGARARMTEAEGLISATSTVDQARRHLARAWLAWASGAHEDARTELEPVMAPGVPASLRASAVRAAEAMGFS